MNRKKPYVSNRIKRNYNRNQNIAAYKSNIKLGPVAHTVLIGLMITVLGLIYLAQATKTTGFDYQLNQIDSKIEELSVKKSDLEIEKARLTSLAAINDSKVAANLVNQGEAEYINQ